MDPGSLEPGRRLAPATDPRAAGRKNPENCGEIHASRGFESCNDAPRTFPCGRWRSRESQPAAERVRRAQRDDAQRGGRRSDVAHRSDHRDGGDRRGCRDLRLREVPPHRSPRAHGAQPRDRRDGPGQGEARRAHHAVEGIQGRGVVGQGARARPPAKKAPAKKATRQEGPGEEGRAAKKTTKKATKRR